MYHNPTYEHQPLAWIDTLLDEIDAEQ